MPAVGDGTLERIDDGIGSDDALSATYVEARAQTLAQLATPGQYRSRRYTDLLSPARLDLMGVRMDFMQRLSGGEPVSKLAFEQLFVESARSDGARASFPDSKTNPGYDVEIDGERYSLKTEAAKRISPNFITVSKFMESAWTKSFRTAEEFAQSLRHVREHLTRYERVCTLRAFRTSGRAVRYELIEIPKALIAAAADSRAEAFTDLTAAGTTRADFTWRGAPAGTIKFDGSDNKITLQRIPVALCVRHAEWLIGSEPAA